MVTNENMIPSGIGILTEDYVIGIVMKQMRGNEEKILEKALLKENSINPILTRYLYVSIALNLIILTLVYLANVILVE